MRGKHRKGNPKYKPSEAKSYIECKSYTNQVFINIDNADNVFEIIEDKDNVMTLKCNNLPSYKMTDICRALTHMGIPFFPQKFSNKIPYLYDWLKGDLSILPLYLDIVVISGTGMSNVILEIYESNQTKSSEFPIFIRFTYGRKVLIFYLPKNVNVNAERPEFIELLHIAEGTKYNVSSYKIISEKKFKPKDTEFVLKYSKKTSQFIE